MAVDMKEMMADAVAVLLFEKNKKKITVKDIVEECSITRQAFYYHFADVPELLAWMISQKADEALKESGKLTSPEEIIRYWLLIGINGKPRMKKGIESNYGRELQQIVFNEMVQLCSRIVDQNAEQGFEVDEYEKNLVIRYHCHAIMGILEDWSEEDTKNLDRIVENIYMILCDASGRACERTMAKRQ